MKAAGCLPDLVLVSLPGLSLAENASADNEATAKMVQELSCH